MRTRTSPRLAAMLIAGLSTLTLPSAHAALFSTTADPNLLVITDTILTLATDIGTMADRIVATEDKIGTMADRILATEDKIGTMADRIVTTETLLTTTLQSLNQGGGLGGGRGELLISPTTGALLSKTTAPTLQLADNATRYVVYISPTPTFDNDQVIPLLVTADTPLQNSWAAALQGYAAPVAYIAVRGVDDRATLSTLSNAVRVTFQ